MELFKLESLAELAGNFLESTGLLKPHPKLIESESPEASTQNVTFINVLR